MRSLFIALGAFIITVTLVVLVAANDSSTRSQSIATKYLKEAPGPTAIVISEAHNGKTIFANEEAQAQVPSASMIKVLLMADIFAKIEAGELALDQLIAVSDEAKIPGGIINELTIDEYTIQDLLVLMITLSDNTATNVLIDLTTFDSVNALAQKLDLPKTKLQRKMLDFEAAKAGRQNYTSALDMNRLFLMLARGEVISPDADAAMVAILRRNQDNHSLKRYIHEDTIIAHKSGWLDNLEHETGIFEFPVATCVLTIFTWDYPSNGEARDFIGNFTKDWYDSLSKMPPAVTTKP